MNINIKDVLVLDNDFKAVSKKIFDDLNIHFEDYGCAKITGTLQEINIILKDLYDEDIIYPYYNQFIKCESDYLLIVDR